MVGSRLGFVTGLAAEARWLRGNGFVVGVGGGGPAGAARAAGAVIAQGVAGLISFGLAGGLDPALPAGALVVPQLVRDGGEEFACDAALLADLGGPTARLMLAGGEIAASVAEKATLFAQSQAAAVDLESGAVARAAAAAAVPFAVLRAISDPAAKDLPPAALVALDAAGRISVARLAGSLLRRPGQVPALLALARDTGRARRALITKLKILDQNKH